MANEFGKLVKQLHERKGLTQDELGQKVGMDKCYISRIENGKKQIRLVTLIKILNGLGAIAALQINVEGLEENIKLL